MTMSAAKSKPAKALGDLCSCGHNKGAHYFDNEAGGNAGNGGRCHATIYTQVPMGMTATMCGCPGFRR